MGNLETHEREQDAITAAWEVRFAQFDPGTPVAPEQFYVSLTWDNWPEGGSYGTRVMADTYEQAEAMAKLEMAGTRCDEDTDVLYWLEAYADSDWHLVDCFTVEEFTNAVQA
jgi:hypothetical protein